MEIALGTALIDDDGLVGMASGFTANFELNGLEEVLVGQTEPPYTERLLPLALLTVIGENRDSAIYLDPGARDWALVDESLASAREPETDRWGPLFGTAVTRSTSSASGRRLPLAFPPTEAPIIALGTGVFDCTGQRIGHLRQMVVESSSGRALRLNISNRPDTPGRSDFPGWWINTLSGGGVILKFSLGEIVASAYRGRLPLPL